MSSQPRALRDEAVQDPPCGSERREADPASVVLREVLDAIPYSVFWKDVGSSYLGCNRRFVKDAGKVDASEIVGQNDYAMPWSRAEADFYRKCDQEVMSSGASLIGIEETQVNASGEQTWLWTSKVPLRTATGEVFGILGIYADITARKRIEQELVAARETAVRANAELTEIQRIMPGALFVVDACGITRNANQASARLLGLESAEELVGLPLARFLEDPEAAGSLGADGGESRREVVMLSKSGERIPTLVAASKLETGAETLVVLIAIDLRDRKRLEMELRQAQKLEAVGRLASGVAHEINTPVQFVSDSVQFLREAAMDLLGVIRALQRVRDAVVSAAPPEEVAAAAAAATAAELAVDLPYLVEDVPKAHERCVDGLTRVAGIVRSMKEFAHPEVGAPTTIDLNRAIESTLTIARNEYKYVADVVTELEPGITLRCHPGELNQAILNIVVNAAHAIEAAVAGTERRGRITIRTSQEAGTVVISISDTGGGIPERVQPHVFDPFFTTKQVGKGTGQGLSIARFVVVEKHGGQLRFESRVGEGTTFFLRLPISGPPGTRG